MLSSESREGHPRPSQKPEFYLLLRARDQRQNIQANLESIRRDLRANTLACAVARLQERLARSEFPYGSTIECAENFRRIIEGLR